jgi:acylphosphatase
MMEIHCVVSGEVQQVAYRAYVQDAATELQICGYAQNMLNGTVSVVAQADPAILKDFVEYLHEGSLLSRVEGVAVDWRTPKKQYTDFSIKH